MAAQEPSSNVEQGRHVFVTTHWSVVWLARHQDPAASAEAREKLCETYWRPLYAYLRRAGYGVHDAQDLTQEFLSRFIHREWLGHLKDQRGKFRSFLLTLLKHFLADEHDRSSAQKRGGGKQFVSMDACEWEERDAIEPVGGLTADQIYDRRWAQALMEQAYAKLAREFAARGKSALFEQLKEMQPREHGEKNYAQIGATFGMTEQAIKSAAMNFRRRYARLLRKEIALTVTDPSQIEEEFQHLMQVFTH